MANAIEILTDVCDHFAQCIYDVEPIGSGMKRWRRYDRSVTDQRLADTAERVRLFDVYPDATAFDGIVEQQGITEVDHNVIVNIDICYGSEDLHTMAAHRDYEAIRRKIFSTASGHVTGYQFPTFAGFEWIDRDDSKFRYIRIPVAVRITVTE